MIIGSCSVDLSLEGVFSLKEKRQIVKSIINRIQSRFNVSIAEIDAQDKWQYSVLGFCCVSNDTAHANSIISKVINFIENDGRVVVIDYSVEII
ncbi:MAG: uncharacterized protein PWR27_616 [Petroclostridium sp.]|jgi:hypothetical protein|uniref:DUF503 domain-containing protein n=1 Tax=Petroclostridium xylanilyticum TaxID=1792311 RepID=UPI000B998A2A|nr:DUF503 domain-containing protein [Petroclostridium xylanilyticum]MBZ4645288.1 hypothetical protein [Clostridia bacterium]MDK2809907.1 uncharacterized protein [Petroclostridium sp.]